MRLCKLFLLLLVIGLGMSIAHASTPVPPIQPTQILSNELLPPPDLEREPSRWLPAGKIRKEVWWTVGLVALLDIVYIIRYGRQLRQARRRQTAKEERRFQNLFVMFHHQELNALRRQALS